ncbi:methyltransferase domain-containing protein [Phialemonium atrogriseum]|uniref:Methyltransferase domain-containing protein n=1 Tax=Phialemonium atrogriseum TaxID=1093897 RepID=A0AAJ0BVR8_9PEZI|nr:methyltransferase domain-containing protein [Phialemonium atrogriseum]KAK1765166.1 methyltransferase domain-containing protein [Phialemonium atrogriseum]
MSHLSRVLALSSSDTGEMRAIYDDWAPTYEKDLADDSQDYVAPAIASTYVAKSLGAERISDKVEILDAGCGTGLVGMHLARLGAKIIDGIDLSQGMLDVARKTGVYRSLETADLSKPLSQKTDSYDVVSCIGTLTQGHVGPGALDEFVRVVKGGGVIVATVLDSIWTEGGYEAKVQGLVTEGKVRLVNSQREDSRRGAGVMARMVVLQVL